MSTQAVKCPVCQAQVYRNARGQILMHTAPYRGPTSSYGRPGIFMYIPVCPGSTRGARP